MFSQHVRTTEVRLAQRAAQKSASASVRGKRAFSIGLHTKTPCLQHRSLSAPCVRPFSSLPLFGPRTVLAKSRAKSRHGGGKIALIGDKRPFYTSPCARWSSYLPPTSRLLLRRTLVLQPGNTAYRDLHLAQGTHRRDSSRGLSSCTDARLFGSIKVHFKDSKGNLLKTVEGNEGDSLLDVAHEYDVDLEGVYPRLY